MIIKIPRASYRELQAGQTTRVLKPKDGTTIPEEGTIVTVQEKFGTGCVTASVQEASEDGVRLRLVK